MANYKCSTCSRDYVANYYIYNDECYCGCCIENVDKDFDIDNYNQLSEQIYQLFKRRLFKYVGNQSEKRYTIEEFKKLKLPLKEWVKIFTFDLGIKESDYE